MTAPISPNGLAGPEATASEQSRMELQARLSSLGGLNGRQLSPEARAKKLREACEGFESIFIQKMWQEMRNAVPKTGILQSREEAFWQDMYDQELSKSMTSAGGIGLADMMYEQLSRNLVSASRNAAGGVTGRAFTPSAAPLISETDYEESPAPLARPASSIYESEAPEARAAAGDVVAAPAQAPAQAPAPQPREVVAASEPLPQQPPVQAHYSPARNTAHTEPRHKAADLNQSSGLLMARQAMRDAGDKLGARAVRPAFHAQAHREKQEEMADPGAVQMAQAASGISQSGMSPGSPEALRAAMEKAKSGYVEASQTQAAIDLHNLVAEAQARNTAPQGVEQVADAQPGVRRVRRTTNIPQNSSKKQIKKNSQAIRMLNVNNVGVNSRQGQGLAAYHAQKDAAEGAAAMTQGQAASPVAAQPASSAPLADQASGQPVPVVPPLTAGASRPETSGSGDSFAIPPLTASRS